MKTIRQLTKHLWAVTAIMAMPVGFTSCSVDDNPADNGQEPAVTLSEAEFFAKAVGAWAEAERWEVKDDGSREFFDWEEAMIGGDIITTTMEIRPDSIYYFFDLYELYPCHHAYSYDYSPNNVKIKGAGSSAYDMEILSITDTEMKTLRRDIGSPLYQVTYKRMDQKWLADIWGYYYATADWWEDWLQHHDGEEWDWEHWRR